MKTLLVISLKNIKYIKKYLIVLLSIFMLFFFFIFLENYYNYKFNKEIINNINNRYIKINVSNIKDKDNFINNLNNNKNISLLYYEYPLIKFNKYTLSYINDDNLDVLNTKISLLKNNEIIVSNTLANIYKINSNFEFVFNNKTYTFLIKGYYDDLDNTKIYSSFDTISNILLDNNLNVSDNILICLLNDYESSIKLIDDLNSKDIPAYFADYTGIQNINTYSKIISIMKILIKAIIVIFFIILYLIINSIIDNDKNNIGYMLICGYNKKDIFTFLSLKSLIILLSYYIFIFIIFILLLITSFMLFNKNLFSILPIIITKSFYALIIVIIFDIINVLILENKSLKKSIISFIKKQEM